MKRLCTAMAVVVMFLLAIVLVLLVAALLIPSTFVILRHLTLLTLATIVATAICIALSS